MKIFDEQNDGKIFGHQADCGRAIKKRSQTPKPLGTHLHKINIPKRIPDTILVALLPSLTYIFFFHFLILQLKLIQLNCLKRTEVLQAGQEKRSTLFHKRVLSVRRLSDLCPATNMALGSNQLDTTASSKSQVC